MKINKISFINPLFLTLFIWLINIVSHIIFPIYFGEINFFTIISVFFYLFFFTIGYYLGYLPTISKKKELLTPRNNLKYFVYLFGSVLFYFFFKVLNEMGPESIIVYRNIVNSSFTEKNELFWLLRLFSLVFFYANIMFFISFGKSRFYWGFVALFFSVLGSGRNYLLIFLLTLFGVFLKESKKNSLIFLLKSFLVLFLFFGVFIVVFDKADSGSSLISSIFFSISSYFLNPLHGFSEITLNFKSWGTSMLLSPGILEFIGLNYVEVPPMPYTDEPVVTNVYTLLWPIYHDLGFIGFAFFGLFYGFLHNYLFRGYKLGNIYLSYFYLLSLYPLFMSIFHDVYLSSIGLWLGAMLPFILFKKINK